MNRPRWMVTVSFAYLILSGIAGGCWVVLGHDFIWLNHNEKLVTWLGFIPMLFIYYTFWPWLPWLRERLGRRNGNPASLFTVAIAMLLIGYFFGAMALSTGVWCYTRYSGQPAQISGPVQEVVSRSGGKGSWYYFADMPDLPSQLPVDTTLLPISEEMSEHIQRGDTLNVQVAVGTFGVAIINIAVTAGPDSP